VKNVGIGKRACTQVLFLSKVELGFFHIFEIVTGWLVPSIGQKIPMQPSWYLPPQKIPLAGRNFFRQVRELKMQRKNPGNALRTNNNKLPQRSISLNCDVKFTSFPTRKVSKP
jgi:hypothetical protein